LPRRHEPTTAPAIQRMCPAVSTASSRKR
jgi:hypothetical protein